MAHTKAATYGEFAALFEPYGTAWDYLRDHFPRFMATKSRFLSRWPRSRGNRVLDIGAHWLQQSVLYAIDDFQVTALDLPTTLDLPNIRALSDAFAIRLLSNSNLEHPGALYEIGDSTFDVVLFTEILEHITFNPVAMWREIHRVMKPGARIVLTTPNYYAIRSRIRQWVRAARRLGGGIEVEQILSQHTFAHHWKEYSKAELQRYFARLSPDFFCVNFAYTTQIPAGHAERLGKLMRPIERFLPPLRPGLYFELELREKLAGIQIEPRW